jgi:hypothetical protein
VIVDQQSNVVFVTYKPDTRFQASILRDAAEEGGAAFLLIQIVARGHVIVEGDQHFFLAGEDRFALLEPKDATTPLPEVDKEVLAIASIDDSTDPIRAHIVQAKPAGQVPAEPAPAEQPAQ